MAHDNTGPRELSPDEREDLIKILSSTSVTGADDLLRQVPATRVTGGIPLLLDLAVDPAAALAPVADGPIPGRWVVEDPAGELQGELLVWVRAGYLDGLEFAWLTDEPPAAFPSPARVRPVDQRPASAPEASAPEAPTRPVATAPVGDPGVGDAPAPPLPAPTVAPGWHTDPSARHQVRYWDGAAWTAHVSDDGVQTQDPL
jgi:hypothetical protein